ncbi:hypothetical protein, partial [Dyella sp.]|uniref:hypothetical protein n=1 Tax=Dyella sp. TaxID=1869338 RepID=UPI002B46007D
IAGYFVPRLANGKDLPEGVQGKGVHSIYTEYDRNIIWAFAGNGAYALSSPLLGKPVLKEPARPWPPR